MSEENEVKVDNAESTETVSPATVSLKTLADKLGTTPKRLRGFLREFFPRDVKKARWEISPVMAKKVERKYKTQVIDLRAKKQQKLQKELEGQA
jgi:hypothetical protein